MQADYSKF